MDSSMTKNRADQSRVNRGNKVIETKSSKINTAKISTRTVLVPKESLTYQNCEELEAMFEECLNQHKTEIILDLKAVSFLDSKALELLIRMHDELRNRGGALKIIGMDSICRDILTATRLIYVFQVYNDIHKAVRDVS